MRQHPPSSEVLRFYAQIAGFQKELFERLQTAAQRGSVRTAQAISGPPELAELAAQFPPFLRLVAQHAPERLSKVAQELLSAPEVTRNRLLDDFWTGANGGTDVNLSEFPCRAFLQPYAEFVRLRGEFSGAGHTRSSCPFCSRKPGVGVLRQQGDGGSRSLICSFCLAEWQFRRILCPNCGEENHSKLPVFTAQEFDHVRVECCDTCKCFLKTVDLTKNGLAEPIVDEIASLPLDLWAHEHGYSKLQLNIMFM